MIAVSTYSGECDGLGYAAGLAGIEVSAYCEADLKRRVKLAEKHPGKQIFESDEELTYAALRELGIHPDLLFGGPPCQPFSCAGAQRGTADPRHRWPEMFRLIRECRPRWVLVENVGNFVNLALDLVWDDLEAEGYEVGPVVLPALAVGAPHRRDRCFVVAYANSGRQIKPRECGNELWVSEAFRAGQGLANAGSSRRENGVSRPGSLQAKTSIEPANGCTDGLAHTVGAREQQPGGVLRQGGGWPVNGGESVGDTNRQRLQIPGQESGYGKIFSADRIKHPSRRAIESRLGRVLDGVSDRLDKVAWTAWRGQEQHPWEPPRTVRGMKDRPRRIESLGLAVVPWQAYPIFALIKEMDDILKEKGATLHGTHQNQPT